VLLQEKLEEGDVSGKVMSRTRISARTVVAVEGNTTGMC
jgi:hypothetical protein